MVSESTSLSTNGCSATAGIPIPPTIAKPAKTPAAQQNVRFIMACSLQDPPFSMNIDLDPFCMQ
jgi:hypothetical protein